MKTHRILTLVTLLVLGCTLAMAQYPEDALRFSTPGLGVGARSLGMGNASTATANDFTSSYSNPAGLALLTMSEFSVGLSHHAYNDDATYFGNSRSFSNNTTNLNDLGLAYVVPATRGSLVFGIGYGRAADYTTGLSFEGFNPVSSIIQDWAPNGEPYPENITRAERLEIALVDTIAGVFDSPIMDSLTQSGKLLEGGGQNYISLSVASEAAKDLFLGLSVNFISGSYSYNYTYREEDLGNVYNTFPFDFSELKVQDIIESDISGFSAKLGMLYKFAGQGRLGLALKTPTWLTIRETYTSDATSIFDDNSSRTDPANGDQGVDNEYDITTPFVFSCGLAYTIHDLTLSGDVEFTDWTEMEFRNVNGWLLSQNTRIKEIFTSTLNKRIGAEYRIPTTNISVRGGFMYIPSPYEGDGSDFAQKFVTAGVGLRVDESILIDVAYAHGTWDTYRRIYAGAYTDIEKITTNNLVSTVSFRF